MPEASTGAASAENSELPKSRLNPLAETGLYKKGFAHAERRLAFFQDTVRTALATLTRDRPLKVLDCGCGTGTWLTMLHDILAESARPARLMGFDVSDGMVQVAQQEPAGIAEESDFRPGDLLDPESFRFPGTEGGFDLIVVYDVIQQLPTARQFEACALVADFLSPGGVAVIFDHDSLSLHGLRMAYRKSVTRRLGIPLVPDYYCNAHYPPLGSFAKKLSKMRGLSAHRAIDSEKKKQTLIVTRSKD